jgi:acetyltransferase
MGQSVPFTHEALPSKEHSVLPGIGPIEVRPLSLADWDAYCAFGRRLERNDVRLRFAGPVKLDDTRFRRLLDIDHDHEEAFAAFGADGAMLGVGRLVQVAPDEAEIALIVRSDLKHRGLGRLLLDRLIRHADAAHLAALRAEVLYENLTMVELARRAGFGFVGSGGPMVAMRMDLTGRHAGAVGRRQGASEPASRLA